MRYRKTIGLVVVLATTFLFLPWWFDGPKDDAWVRVTVPKSWAGIAPYMRWDSTTDISKFYGPEFTSQTDSEKGTTYVWDGECPPGQYKLTIGMCGYVTFVEVPDQLPIEIVMPEFATVSLTFREPNGRLSSLEEIYWVPNTDGFRHQNPARATRKEGSDAFQFPAFAGQMKILVAPHGFGPYVRKDYTIDLSPGDNKVELEVSRK